MLEAIEALPLSATIRASVWAYPLLETVHIAAFAVVFGALVVFELRVLGLGRAIPLQPLLRLAVPTALCAFAVAACAGVLMLVSRATELATHPAFVVKLGLIAAAGVNAFWFHRRGSVVLHDTLAKMQALVSMVLWLSIITAGRLIAYL